MSLKNCEECQNPISTMAYECPHCGKACRLRPRLNVGDIALGVMLGTLGTTIVVWIIYFLIAAIFR